MFCSTCLVNLNDKQAISIDKELSEGGATLRDALDQIGVANFISNKGEEIVCLTCTNTILTGYWFKERTQSFVKLFNQCPEDIIVNDSELSVHFEEYRRDAKKRLRQITTFLTQAREAKKTKDPEYVAIIMQTQEDSEPEHQTTVYNRRPRVKRIDMTQEVQHDHKEPPPEIVVPVKEEEEMNSVTSPVVGRHALFQCDHCPSKFSAAYRLERHLKVVHPTTGTPNKATVVKRKLKKEVKENETAPSGDNILLCAECGMSFTKRNMYIVHRRRHMGIKPFKCGYCEKAFPRKDDLVVHERYHTGVKPYACKVCSKAFARSYNLIVHQRIHTGEKPHRCRYCERSFAQCNDLKTHLRRHTGERFKCNVCSEEFLMRYQLTRHKKDAHNIEVAASTGRLKKLVLRVSESDKSS